MSVQTLFHVGDRVQTSALRTGTVEKLYGDDRVGVRFDIADEFGDFADILFADDLQLIPETPVTTPAETASTSFEEIALRSAARGESRVLPILVGGKNPLIKWKDSHIDEASTEQWAALYPAWIEEIAAKFPDVNVAVIPKPNEHLFIDEDESERFRKGYEKFSGEPFPETYTTSARANRCQSHWKQTERTRKMG